MPDVVNVRFRGRGKVYYFDPAGHTPAAGDAVVVETANGLELGDCVEGVHVVDEGRVVSPLRPVIRLATEEDIQTAAQNRQKEQEAFAICEEKIRNHGLDMKLVDVEYSFEGGKIRFFFTSDGRVDFRELVKDLASVFHTRIDLRQIGVRDGAKMLGGLGICGRPFCCATFLDEFQPVSIRMAKTQNLSLNPSKISGTCGRLMCCLKYEQDAYEHLIKSLPKADAQVDTPKGKGVITEVNLLRRTAKVRLLEGPETTLQVYSVDRLGYTLGGEYIAPKPEESKPVPLPDMPDLSDYMADRPARADFGAENGEKNGEKSGERRRDGRSRSQKPKDKDRSPRSGDGQKPEPRPAQPNGKPGEKGEWKSRAPRSPRRQGGQGAQGGQRAPGQSQGQAPQNATRGPVLQATPRPAGPKQTGPRPGPAASAQTAKSQEGQPVQAGEKSEKKLYYKRYRRPGKKPGGAKPE